MARDNLTAESRDEVIRWRDARFSSFPMGLLQKDDGTDCWEYDEWTRLYDFGLRQARLEADVQRSSACDNGCEHLACLLGDGADDKVRIELNGGSVEYERWRFGDGEDFDDDDDCVRCALVRGDLEWEETQHGFPFAHSWAYLPDWNIDAEVAGDAGFLVYEFRGHTVMGIDGGGYGFVEAHWAPLYEAVTERKLDWLD